MKLIGTSEHVDPDIAQPGSWAPVALAVDFVGDKLYVVDSIVQKIDVFEFNGRYHGIVLSSNLTSPADIALDPLVGLMFVADSKQVLRANMDGTNAFPIVSEAAYKVSGVAADLIAKRVYWCDLLLDYIETADYMGRNRVMVLRGSQVRYSYRKLIENLVFLIINKESKKLPGTVADAFSAVREQGLLDGQHEAGGAERGKDAEREHGEERDEATRREGYQGPALAGSTES